MSDFNQGDRVRYVAGPDYFVRDRVGEEGTVVGEPDGKSIDVDFGYRHPVGVYLSNLELVERSAPAVGDRVRVVHEGVVSSVDGKYFSLEADGDFEFYDEPGTSMTVEILERAPKPVETYPVGTVAISRLAPETPAVRGDERWHGVNGDDWSRLDDKTVRENPHFTVVHEPAP
jgi:hypothetical protein